MVEKCPSTDDDGYQCEDDEGHSGEHWAVIRIQWIEIPKLTDVKPSPGYSLWLANKYGRGKE